MYTGGSIDSCTREGYYHPMHPSKHRIFAAAVSVVLSIYFIGIVSCSRDGIESLKRESLFSVPIGKAEDELTFFRQGNWSFDQDITVRMQDGIVYLGVPDGFKVMKFNSYGDILELFFNRDKNPPPYLLSGTNEDGSVSNRVAYHYPFNLIGEIAVADNFDLLVQDEVPKERREFDNDLGVMLDQVVLRFDRSGNFIDYLGQEGSGGTPFPYIERIQTNHDLDTIVFCRTPRSWIVYWFSHAGYLKYTITFNLDRLPLLEDAQVPSLETIFADTADPLLYLKIDFYKSRLGEATQARTGIEYFQSMIYAFDVEAEEYTRAIEIPKHYRSGDSLDFVSLEREQLLYEFTGTADGGTLTLISPIEGSYYELLLLNREGRVIKRAKVLLSDQELIYRDFFVTEEGILLGILCTEFAGEVVWWRSDRFIDVERDE